MITKEPTYTKAFSLKRYFTKSARSAFLHILRKERDTGKTLLLPAYIGMNAYEGSGVFDVVQISRIPYEFYSVDEKLAPIESSLPSNSDKAYSMLLIHYFGFAPHNFKEILLHCKKNGICLIEDCAHTLSGTFQGKSLGSFGTYAFHSIHKILPTKDGGLLIDNTLYENFEIDVLDEGIQASTIAQFANSDLAAISEKRIANYHEWIKVISDFPELQPMYPNRLDGVVPLNFPVFVKNDQREALYFFLMEHQAPTCALYYKMIPQISEIEFPASYQISRSILNLPTHQDTTFEDIEQIALAIKAFYKL